MGIRIRIELVIKFIISSIMLENEICESYNKETNTICKEIAAICGNRWIRLGRIKRMLEFFKKLDVKNTGIFAAGVVFGTAGIKVLASKDAKKLYTNCTAAVLRAKDCVMKTATTIQENAEDIYAEAQLINEERALKEAEMEMEDAFEEDAEEFEEAEQSEA